VARHLGPIERHAEEETQRRHRAVDGWRAHAGLGLVQLEAAEIFWRCPVGRLVKVLTWRI
jgi:hypothetical protein